MIDTKHVTLLDTYFDFIYGKEMKRVLFNLRTVKCKGCMNGYLSQRDHSCLLLTTQQQIVLYWDEILERITETDIIVKWHETVLSIDHIPGTLTDMYKLKLISCWLVVLRFNATLTAKVIWRSVTHMSFLAFSHQY